MYKCFHLTECNELIFQQINSDSKAYLITSRFYTNENTGLENYQVAG